MNTGLEPGTITVLSPRVRRLVAPNPGMMTGPGTNTYLVGEREIAVIDPGPAMQQHVDAILAAAGDRLRFILVTHTHTDHSPATAALAQKSGAKIIGRPAPRGEHQDAGFSPDRVPEEGDTINGDGFALRALHTPGHASNHVCYLLDDENLLFTGDHIINGSTVVIDPPDGDMNEYLSSLARLKRETLTAIAPGHGELIHDPYEAISKLIAHRLNRESIVVDALRAHPRSTVRQLLPHVYTEIDAALYPVAERSLLAHLLKLDGDDYAECSNDRWQLRALR